MVNRIGLCAACAVPLTLSLGVASCSSTTNSQGSDADASHSSSASNTTTSGTTSSSGATTTTGSANAVTTTNGAPTGATAGGTTTQNGTTTGLVTGTGTLGTTTGGANSTSSGAGGTSASAATLSGTTTTSGTSTGDTSSTTTGGGTTEPCTGAGSLSAGDSGHSLTVGGNTYPFNVHTPPGYDGVTRMPVVFDFHGLGGNENQMKNLSGWAATGDNEGFITVFPGGVDNAWNAGGCCSQTTTDVDFVRQAIDYLDAEGCIDTKRIYASGCSNGGAMSYRLACEAADVIAAVAPVDFDCVVGGRCASCTPSRPITEIQFRGTNDSAVPYSGAEPNFEVWGEINQCTGSPETLPENASCERHTECAEGVESILCTVQDGPHCGSYMSFGIANLAWSIISRYSLP